MNKWNATVQRDFATGKEVSSLFIHHKISLLFNGLTVTIISFISFYYLHLGQFQDKQQTVPLCCMAKQAQQKGQKVYEEFRYFRRK